MDSPSASKKKKSEEASRSTTSSRHSGSSSQERTPSAENSENSKSPFSSPQTSPFKTPPKKRKYSESSSQERTPPSAGTSQSTISPAQTSPFKTPPKNSPEKFLRHSGSPSTSQSPISSAGPRENTGLFCLHPECRGGPFTNEMVRRIHMYTFGCLKHRK
ncbi:hypothetical protein DBV15_03193 [Temnothorax longispinosus]|uniref:Uncharacterized protein n=1 Tax=Temnothorax longispinosus TaxID=300112 RepID=A0A4S2L3Q7_9HYME|nr:hypothetical protein DBV15_03193 [Temnothorax longispinosus]